MSDFVTFQEFETRAEADALAEQLKAHDIPATVEQNRNLLDQNIIGRQYNNYILVKIKGEDFARAQKVLLDATEVDMSQLPENYMLLSFTNDELIDVLAKPDEWGPFNYKLALMLLERKGVAIDDRKTEELQHAHLLEASTRRSLGPAHLLFGYGFTIICILAIVLKNKTALLLLSYFYGLPIFIGFVLGMVFRFTRRTLPDGSRIYSYDDSARKHGLFMLLLSTIVMVLLTSVFLLIVSGAKVSL